MSVVSPSSVSQHDPRRAWRDTDARTRRQRVISGIFLVLLWAATVAVLAIGTNAVIAMGG
jgi:uncharacterized membrane protein